ncbi:MAG: hypothetical protein COU45_06645 [Nitrosopumilus sp. CG10_big_fil_rev_8_21_14_0_10_33_7]|nr:MAG: hypothetical protein COU45_06645 [Nitrosopumilus sp. CG10_big_fil_rev_8_21_14_0_10_33_7]
MLKPYVPASGFLGRPGVFHDGIVGRVDIWSKDWSKITPCSTSGVFLLKNGFTGVSTTAKEGEIDAEGLNDAE